jgi:putative membrane protein
MAGRPYESSARDHLANERTFLAYVRTSLAFVAFGFGIARFAIAFRELAMARSQTTSGPSVIFGETMVGVGSTKSLSPRLVIAIAAILIIFGVFTAYDLLRYWTA